jgi:hypothetical protein
MKEEIWKDIEGFEGLYQISSFGRVKSLPKKWVMTNNFGTFWVMKDERILSPVISNKGYYVLSLVKNKRKKQFRVHQLVATHFLENNGNYNCINHIDGDKLNNNIENLEYCTHSHNQKEAFRLGLKQPSKSMLGRLDDLCPNSIPINQYTLDGVFIKRWNSAREAMRHMGKKSNKIYMCCKHRKSQMYGYKWEYADE